MPAVAEIRALLRRLDGEPADAIESEVLECKPWILGERDSCIRAVREAVVCLANARGGTVVVGVKDRVRSRAEAIQGVGDLGAEGLRRSIYDGTDPHILVDIEELVEPEGRLLLIHVPRGMPPHTTADGVAKRRVGKDCVPITGSDLRGMLFAGGRDLSAEPIPGASLADLDGDQVRLLRRTIETEGGNPELARLDTPELLRNLGLLRGDEVSFAAVLMLGSPPAFARFAPQHEVSFIRFRTQTRYDVRHDLRGPLLAVLDALVRLHETHVRIDTVDAVGLGEMPIPTLTWKTLREAALNALIHRDYFLRQSILIELHEDRLQISSPGGFIGGVTPQNIVHHPPVRRNPLLASVMQTVGLVNRAGMGVDRMCEEMLRLGKGMPRYEGDEAHVRVILKTRTHAAFARFVAAEERAGRRLSLDDLILLRAAADRGHLDRWSASERLQLSEDEAAEKLAELRGRGYLVAHGRGRGTDYRLARPHSDLLRGPSETDLDLPLDDEAVRLRVQAVLAERGRLTNSEIRRLSGYSRSHVTRMMRELAAGGLASVRGRGRAAHYIPGPRLAGRGRGPRRPGGGGQ